MRHDSNSLSGAERASIVSTLTAFSTRLDEAGELLAALKLRHALECLDPDSPINQQIPHDAAH